METDFTPQPHKEAVALITGKPVVVKRVFNQMLPEIRARAFTVAGIESANALQRIRDAVASVPLGAQGGQTWDQAKRQIADELESFLGDGADRRAELVLRTNTFQAYSASIHHVAHADEDTTHLQYLHGECAVPTPSHLALNGIILPKDDPFWETHTGPWGHLGCVCYVRPMNIDQVDAERAEDEKKNPEDRNLIEGPARRKLHEGEIIRGGQRHDVTIDGPDNAGFKWHPGDLKIPLKDLAKKYDAETWSHFQNFAQQQPLDEKRSVWDWLNGSEHKSAFIPGLDQNALPVRQNPVSNALDYQGMPKAFQTQLQSAVEAINLVHDDGALPKIPVKRDASKSHHACFVHTHSGQAVSIRVSKFSSHPEISHVHEIGHFLDLSAIGHPGQFESHNPSGLMKDVIQAIEGTDAIKSIRARPASRERNYYLKRHEMWARAYAQFIAEESKHSALLSGLSKAFDEYSGKQWAEEDFKPVKAAIRNLFKKLNWS